MAARKKRDLVVELDESDDEEDVKHGSSGLAGEDKRSRPSASSRPRRRPSRSWCRRRGTAPRSRSAATLDPAILQRLVEACEDENMEEAEIADFLDKHA